MFKDEAMDLAVLLLVSLVLSVYLFFYMPIISMDGAFQHIPMAKMFAEGSFRDALKFSGQQPLFALLVSWVSPRVGDFELGARWVSSFFGILLILPVYFLGKQVFDRRVAFLSCLFLAIHPYIRRFSADALKESTYLFFLATAIWFTVRALRRERAYLFLFCSSLLRARVSGAARWDRTPRGCFLLCSFHKEVQRPGKERKGNLLLDFVVRIPASPSSLILKGRGWNVVPEQNKEHRRVDWLGAHEGSGAPDPSNSFHVPTIG